MVNRDLKMNLKRPCKMLEFNENSNNIKPKSGGNNR